MKLGTFLALCRISNLPTVWSNVLAGAMLARPLEGFSDSAHVVAAGAAGSLFYSGGMLLNDAFDAEIDARERPERPIPSGRVARRTVLALGYAMLGLALALLVALAVTSARAGGMKLVAAGVLTALGVLVYDRWHKGFAWSPVVMGFCRACLYAMGAYAASPTLGEAFVPALLLWGYVIGLTHVARFENASAVGRMWPTLLLFSPVVFIVLRSIWLDGPIRANIFRDMVVPLSIGWTLGGLLIARRGGSSIGRAVVRLIAGISIVDMAFLASMRPGAWGASLLALGAFSLTLVLQRWVRGT